MSHEMTCEQCGVEFDKRDLTQVLVHEHQGPVPIMACGPGVCIRRPGESAEDAVRRLGGDVARLESEAVHCGEALSIEVDAHAATRAQVEALREALEGAARSLHTAATWGTLVDYQGDLLDLRAWAANQEAMARAALSASPPGVRVGLTTEERAELKAILDQRGPGRLTVLARKLLDGEGT